MSKAFRDTLTLRIKYLRSVVVGVEFDTAVQGVLQPTISELCQCVSWNAKFGRRRSGLCMLADEAPLLHYGRIAVGGLPKLQLAYGWRSLVRLGNRFIGELHAPTAACTLRRSWWLGAWGK